MNRPGFFDVANRYAGRDVRNDPLLKIDSVVPWEKFRPHLEAVWRKPANQRKSSAGRKPWDGVVLCALYNLSDDQVEYQIRDRLSFVRFSGLGLEDKVPDARTVWLYRERLGQIIDASIVSVPTRHNKRDETAKIKQGETPEGWEDKPARRSLKGTDARWTKNMARATIRVQEPHQRGLLA